MDRPTPPAGLSLLVSKTIAARAPAKDDHNNNKNKKWKKEVLIATMPPSPIKYYWILFSFLWISMIGLAQKRVFFKKTMGQFRPLYVYFRYCLDTISIIQIEKSRDGVLGIRTLGRRMVGADETTELWRPPKKEFLVNLFWAGKNDWDTIPRKWIYVCCALFWERSMHCFNSGQWLPLFRLFKL